MATVWIPNHEYAATMNKKEDAYAAMVNAQNKLNAAQAAADEQEYLLQKEMQDFLEKINELKSQMNLETGVVTEKMADLEQQIRLELGRIKIWYSQLLNQLNAEVENLEAEVAQVDANFEEFVSYIMARISEIEGDITEKRLQADLYFHELKEQYENLQGLHFEILKPILNEEFRNILQDVESDIDQKAYEAAMALAQTYIAKGNTTKEELKLLNTEFEDVKAQSLKLAEELKAEFNLLQNAKANRVTICEKPAEIVFDGEYDFWTEGAFADIVEEFKAVNEDLVNSLIPKVQIEEIKTVISHLYALKERMSQCTELAKGEFVEYYFVKDTAQTILETMKDTSWKVKKASFQEDDKRNAYCISVNNGSGMSATIVILHMRELLSIDRRGKKKFGKTQFRVTIEEDDNMEERDQQKCERVLQGVLCILSEAGDIGEINRKNNQCISEDDVEEFVYRCNAESYTAKRKRFAEMINYAGGC